MTKLNNGILRPGPLTTINFKFITLPQSYFLYVSRAPLSLIELWLCFFETMVEWISSPDLDIELQLVKIIFVKGCEKLENRFTLVIRNGQGSINALQHMTLLGVIYTK